MSTRYLMVQQMLRIHNEVMLDHGQQSILIDRSKLESAVARPQTEAFGVELFPTLAEKAASLLQATIIAHPFMDGNKRAGLAAMLMFLRIDGVRAVPDLEALYDLVIAVTTGELGEVTEIAERLRGLFAGLS